VTGRRLDRRERLRQRSLRVALASASVDSASGDRSRDCLQPCLRRSSAGKRERERERERERASSPFFSTILLAESGLAPLKRALSFHTFHSDGLSTPERFCAADSCSRGIKERQLPRDDIVRSPARARILSENRAPASRQLSRCFRYVSVWFPVENHARRASRRAERERGGRAKEKEKEFRCSLRLTRVDAI